MKNHRDLVESLDTVHPASLKNQIAVRKASIKAGVKKDTFTRTLLNVQEKPLSSQKSGETNPPSKKVVKPQSSVQPAKHAESAQVRSSKKAAHKPNKSHNQRKKTAANSSKAARPTYTSRSLVQQPIVIAQPAKKGLWAWLLEGARRLLGFSVSSKSRELQQQELRSKEMTRLNADADKRVTVQGTATRRTTTAPVPMQTPVKSESNPYTKAFAKLNADADKRVTVQGTATRRKVPVPMQTSAKPKSNPATEAFAELNKEEKQQERASTVRRRR